MPVRGVGCAGGCVARGAGQTSRFVLGVASLARVGRLAAAAAAAAQLVSCPMTGEGVGVRPVYMHHAGSNCP